MICISSSSVCLHTACARLSPTAMSQREVVWGTLMSVVFLNPWQLQEWGSPVTLSGLLKKKVQVLSWQQVSGFTSSDTIKKGRMSYREDLPGAGPQEVGDHALGWWIKDLVGHSKFRTTQVQGHLRGRTSRSLVLIIYEQLLHPPHHSVWVKHFWFLVVLVYTNTNTRCRLL